MIDIFLFEQQFQRFREHVINESGMDLTSFSSNPYTEVQEGTPVKVSTCTAVVDGVF
jgi:hypothetical protein